MGAKVKIGDLLTFGNEVWSYQGFSYVTSKHGVWKQLKFAKTDGTEIRLETSSWNAALVELTNLELTDFDGVLKCLV